MGLFFKKKTKPESAYTPPVMNFVSNINKEYSVSGIETDAAAALAKKTEGFPFDYDTLKSIYDVGDTVYEYELHARKDRVSIKPEGEIINVFVDGVKIGNISKKGSEEIQNIINQYEIKRLSLDLYFGSFQKIGKNDYADVETYGEDDSKWVTSDQLSKPKGKLMVGYDKPW